MYQALIDDLSLSYFMKKSNTDIVQTNRKNLNGVAGDLVMFYETFGHGVIGTKLIDANGEHEQTNTFLIEEYLVDLKEFFKDRFEVEEPPQGEFWIFGHDFSGWYGLVEKTTGKIFRYDIGPLYLTPTDQFFEEFLRDQIAVDKVNVKCLQEEYGCTIL